MPGLSPEAHNRAVDFVAGNASNFIERYKAAKEVATPVVDERAALDTGSQEIMKAAANIDHLCDVADKAAEDVEAALEEFAEKHYEEADALVTAAYDKRRQAIDQEASDFGFRTRQAIGLAELVSMEKAFGALDACRKEVHEMERANL